MRDTVRAARVGALVLAALVVGLMVWRQVDERSSTDEGYRVHALFDDASGLIAKSRVTVAGIPVGYIDAIELEGNRARIEIFVRSDVRLYGNGNVARRSASLLGEYLLAINPGNETGELLEDGDRLAVEETPSTGDILADVGRIAGSLRNVATQIERVFGTEEGGPADGARAPEPHGGARGGQPDHPDQRAGGQRHPPEHRGHHGVGRARASTRSWPTST
jgi:phospholipid/cholesterol/gamma-HCH transport system substrate-binding protein